MIISTTRSLKKFTEKLKNKSYIAVDTEFKRTNTFFAQLCLIQIATDEEQVIIDPLIRNVDLSSLFEVFADKNILKIFFAARQDLEIIHQVSGGIEPKNIFDCQIAAQFCGCDINSGYRQLVQNLVNITLDKSMQYTDWSQRPLKREQLEYAILDVKYLHDIYKHLFNKIQNTGRLSWLEHELEINNSKEKYSINYMESWKRLKIKITNSRDFWLLKNLADWREREAIKSNLPRSWICSDQLIQAAITNKPKEKSEIDKIIAKKKLKSMNDYNKYSILKIIKEAKALETENLPILPEKIDLPNGTKKSLEQLKLLLQKISTEENIASSMIANIHNLKEFIYLLEKHPDKIKDSAIMQNWRYDIFGKAAYKLLGENK